MASVYDRLPDDIRDLIEDKYAVHDFLMSFGQALDGDDLKTAQERYPAATHPVVRVHPETGAKCLFVNSIFTRNIVGMDATESERVSDLLFLRRQCLSTRFAFVRNQTWSSFGETAVHSTMCPVIASHITGSWNMLPLRVIGPLGHGHKL